MDMVWIRWQVLRQYKFLFTIELRALISGNCYAIFRDLTVLEGPGCFFYRGFILEGPFDGWKLTESKEPLEKLPPGIFADVKNELLCKYGYAV